MDQRRFDDLTRRLASGMPRRSVVRIAAAAIAGRIALPNLSASAGNNKNKNSNCKNIGKDCSNEKCCSGGICCGGTCRNPQLLQSLARHCLHEVPQPPHRFCQRLEIIAADLIIRGITRLDIGSLQ